MVKRTSKMEYGNRKDLIFAERNGALTVNMREKKEYLDEKMERK